MSQTIQLIVGLGNPGKEYAKTRHNAGTWLVSALAEQHRATWQATSKLHSLTTTVIIDNQDCRLLIPTTYMNLSGQAVQAATHYYKITPEQLLVVHDEIDLSVGVVRIKIGGGHGGHNGLRDIDAKLGTQKYTRIRIGVGRPAHAKQVVDYVLHEPSRHEMIDIERAIGEAYNVLPMLLAGDSARAMQQLHTED